MVFEWDDNKDVLNQKKHDISFSESISVFDDPDALSLYDESHSDDEDRWVTMGLSVKGNLLVIVHTYRKHLDVERIRIISSRRADKEEEISYYNRVR